MTDEREAQRAEIKAAWSDAGERLSGLGAKLKQHYAEQQGTEPQQAGAEVKEAVKRLGAAVQDAFEAIGSAAHDDAVKRDVKEVGQSVASALGATFTVVGDEVRKAFEANKGSVRDAGTDSTSDGPAPSADAWSSATDAPEYGSPPASTVQDAPSVSDPPIGAEEPAPATPKEPPPTTPEPPR